MEIAVPRRCSGDTRDHEEEASVLQLTQMGAEMERKQTTPGRQCKLHLKQPVCKGLEPSSSHCVFGSGSAKGSALMSTRAWCPEP